MSGVEPVVRLEVRPSVAVITLDRPHVLNAIDAQTAEQLGAAFASAERNPTVHAIVLAGTGRAFCAGMDLTAFSTGERAIAATHPEWGWAGVMRQRITTPVIAAVQGVALGLGAELALAADLLVMEEDARLGLPEVSVGLLAAAGGAIRMAQQLPPKIALEVLLTGEPLDASTLAGYGLVNRVAPPGTAIDVALALAARIARNAPVAVRVTKRLAHETAQLAAHDDRAWNLSAEAEASVFGTHDAREGIAAFRERRAPRWKGF